ncbi:hypothetical protein B879_04106 [Cecembia lonarensis LW9]|uniref:Uncharacterized protein n=1 Tax=Cecembia lonarensis (strain CCUG 58316 / KCTC 22772 / LW9) TaxID=1225176 RepID=K1KT20_CECL9|nr:hypothetical protein B879_04106 [Cecembia lonarensis LW9]
MISPYVHIKTVIGDLGFEQGFNNPIFSRECKRIFKTPSQYQPVEAGKYYSQGHEQAGYWKTERIELTETDPDFFPCQSIKGKKGPAVCIFIQ